MMNLAISVHHLKKNKHHKTQIKQGMKTEFPFTDLHANIEEYYEKTDHKIRADQPHKFTNWEEIRSYYPLDKDIVYLNSGTEGSMPVQVLSEYNDYLHKWASNPSYYFAFNKITQDWQKVNRAKVAEFISTTEENLCITSNTTEGLGMVIMGLPFEEGDEVIVSLQAYPSLISPLNVLCKTRKIKYKIVPLPTYLDTKQEIVDAFAAAITPKTKAICVSHITYTTGLRLPVKEICDLARKHNAISLIDGAHATGMIPLDMEQIGCDFYAAAGHKWLNGPPGTGILYIREALKNEHKLLPILSELYGFENTYSITDMLQIRGCNNTPGYTALCGAIRLNTDIGKERILNRILELNDYAKERIIEEWGENALISPFGSDKRDLCSGIASFIPSRDYNKRFDEAFITGLSSELINNYNIWIRYINFVNDPSVTENKTWALRVSTNLFNNTDDIDKLFDTLVKIA